MKTRILSLFIFSICLLLGGCFNSADLYKDKNGENISDLEGEITTTDYVLPDGCGWNFGFPTDLSPHDAFHIINSQEDMKSLIYCEDNVPVVDFNKYSLLLFICNYGENLTHQIQQVAEYRYKWNIDIKGITRGKDLNILILIPKLPQNATVDLDINYDDTANLSWSWTEITTNLFDESYCVVQNYKLKGDTTINNLR